MNKHIYDEATNVSYTLQGHYYLPDFALSEEEHPIGIWGQRHRRYLKQHRKVQYCNLLTSGRLNSYLADINVQAENMFSQLVVQMRKQEGVNEQLKADNVMVWAKRMNNIRNKATETVNSEIIFR